MSRRNDRYLRQEPTKVANKTHSSQNEGSTENGSKDGRRRVLSLSKSAKANGGFQGIRGKEVIIRQPVVISMPKRIQKGRQPPKFPTLQRVTKKEKLANIKSRLLALKYGYVWERKTFGCVTPSRARKHFEEQLMKKCLRQWEDIWWNGRNEWKLNIRADYHNRFRLWLKTWRAWRSFVTLRKLKKMKINMAKRKVHYVYLKKCFACWRRHVSQRHHKKQFYQKAEDQGEILAKRAAFSRWKNSLNFKRKLMAMEEQALHFWAGNLFFKAWECWKFTYSLAVEEERKVIFAVQFYNRRLAFKVFGAFKLYTVQRKLKTLRQLSGERYYRLQCLRHWFLVWKIRWTRQAELARFESTIQHKAVMAKKRRMFAAWKHYIILVHLKQQSEHDACNHLKISLKKKYFNAFQKLVTDRKRKISREFFASSFYKMSLVRKAWKLWLSRCENREELRLMTLNNFVRNHYRSTVLKKVIKAWRCHCHARKVRKADKETADEMAKRILLPRYFQRWETFIEIFKERQRTEQKALNFRRECLLAKMYYNWWKSYQQSLDAQMLYRMAVISYDGKIKQQFFKVWLTKARWRLKENSLMARGNTHYEQQLKRTCLKKWIKFVKHINHSLGRLEMAVRHQNKKLLSITWAHWTKFIHRRRKKWKLVAIANLSFNHRILKKALFSWKIHSDNMKKIKAYAEERKAVYENMAIRTLFTRWRNNAMYLKEAKEMHYRSFQHWKFQTEKKVFISWRRYTNKCSWKKQRMLCQIESARKQLNEGKLRRYFQTWRQAFFFKVAYNTKLRKATEHWRKRTLKKNIDKWMKYRFLGYRKLVLQQQCMWYHNQRIIASSLKIWKANYQERADSTKKCNIALWMWSFTLQRKVFLAWIQYADKKKRQKAAINEALKRRRDWLYKLGVTRWIKFAAHSMAERESFAASRHIRLSQDVQRCVYRCAVHWRRKAVSNRGKKQPKTDPDSFVKRRNILSDVSFNKLETNPQKSGNIGNIVSVISKGGVKRAKPRRPEYLRESFKFSESFAEGTVVSTKPADDPEAVPRKWRSDFQPAVLPPRLQKPSSFTSLDGIESSADSEIYLPHGRDSWGPAKPRGNHVLMPPSCFVAGEVPLESKPDPKTMREIASDLKLPKDINKNQRVVDSYSIEAIHQHLDPILDGKTMPGFLSDQHTQQSIIGLRDRMLKYYTVSMKLRNLQRRLKSLRQWSKDPRREEDKLDDEEMNFLCELIDKLSRDVDTTSQNLNKNHKAIAKDLKQFLENVT